MRRAAARGLLPGPATADPREPGTWLRLGTIARGLRDEAEAEVLRLRHARALALFTPELDANARQQLFEAADKIEDAIEHIARPWAGKAASNADMKAMEDRWESIWGSMDDPATKAKIEEACRQLKPRAGPPNRKAKRP